MDKNANSSLTDYVTKHKKNTILVENGVLHDFGQYFLLELIQILKNLK